MKAGSVNWQPPVGQCVYVAFFQCGMGPVVWTLTSEIYPSDVRGTASAISAGANWVSNLAVALTFLTLMEALHTVQTFVAYAVMCVLAIVFVFVYVPETKGKSMQAVTDELAGYPRPCCFRFVPCLCPAETDE